MIQFSLSLESRFYLSSFSLCFRKCHRFIYRVEGEKEKQFEDGEKKLKQSENREEVFPSPKASESFFVVGKARGAMCFDWNGVKFGALKHIRGFHIININYANFSSHLA